MPAPSPDIIVINPPPLNSFTAFPYKRDIFPADLIFGPLGRLAGIVPLTTANSPFPVPTDKNPARKEAFAG